MARLQTRGTAKWALLAAGIGALLLYYSLGIAYNNDGRLRVAIALSSSALAGVIGALTAASSILSEGPRIGGSLSSRAVGVVALLLNVAVCVAGVAVALFLRW